MVTGRGAKRRKKTLESLQRIVPEATGAQQEAIVRALEGYHGLALSEMAEEHRSALPALLDLFFARLSAESIPCRACRRFVVECLESSLQASFDERTRGNRSWLDVLASEWGDGGAADQTDDDDDPRMGFGRSLGGRAADAGVLC